MTGKMKNGRMSATAIMAKTMVSPSNDLDMENTILSRKANVKG